MTAGLIGRVFAVLSTQFFAQVATALPQAQTDCLLVRSATINARAPLSRAEFAYEKDYGAKEIERANYGHEVIAGGGLVLVLRYSFDDGAGVDSGIFRKLTLEIGRDSYNKQVPNKRTLRSFYVAGGVGHVHKGHYWYAENPSITVVIRQSDSGAKLEIGGEFTVTSRQNSKATRREKIEYSCQLKERVLGSLSPWLGGSGAGHMAFIPEVDSVNGAALYK